ncbi:MAG: hypothetical protein U5P10_08410 [Spirochaetia bacterium]|nr:hypothetical protein [Spirochaetia bacterium]
MSALVVILVVLAIRSVTLPGAGEGLSFYLKPDFGKLMETGLWEAVYAVLWGRLSLPSVWVQEVCSFSEVISEKSGR